MDGISPHLAGVPKPVDALVTVVWVVGITNAFNLLDNMDGLSAGIAVIAALAIFGVALLQHRYLVSALALALAGCAAGFLRANFHPAKITWETQAACSSGSSWLSCCLSCEQTPRLACRWRSYSRYRASPSSTRHLSRCPD